MAGFWECPPVANGAYAYPPPPTDGTYPAGPPPGYSFSNAPPAGRGVDYFYYCPHYFLSLITLSSVGVSLIFAGGFAGGFYHNPPTFDAAAGHMAPPPYSAPLGQQPPHDPDLPSSAAGALIYGSRRGRGHYKPVLVVVKVLG